MGTSPKPLGIQALLLNAASKMTRTARTVSPTEPTKQKARAFCRVLVSLSLLAILLGYLQT